MPIVASDSEDIRALIARYAFALDLGAAEEFATCFTDNGSFEIVGLPEGHPFARRFEGRDALAEFHTRFRAATGGRLRHLAVNVEIHVDGSGATTRCYLLTVSAGAAATNGATGIYRDELRKADAGWLFSTRQVTVDI
jgi:uncharacterized protein (TIGR02246 family)